MSGNDLFGSGHEPFPLDPALNLNGDDVDWASFLNPDNQWVGDEGMEMNAQNNPIVGTGSAAMNGTAFGAAGAMDVHDFDGLDPLGPTGAVDGNVNPFDLNNPFVFNMPPVNPTGDDDPFDIDFDASFDPNQRQDGHNQASVTNDQTHLQVPQTAPTQDAPATPTSPYELKAGEYPPARLSVPAYPPSQLVPTVIQPGHYPPAPEPPANPGAIYWARKMEQQRAELAAANANLPVGPQPSPTANRLLDPRLRDGPQNPGEGDDRTASRAQANVDREGTRTLPTPQSAGTAKGRYTNPAAPGLRPIAPKPIAPMPQPGLGVANAVPQGTKNATNVAPTPAVPVKKEASNAKKSAPKKSVSKAKQKAVKVPIFRNQLLVSTLAEAQQVATKRIPLKVVDDDRDEVAAHAEIWIPLIAQAFDVDFRPQPEHNEKYTDEGRAEFTRWQKEHENKVWAIFAEQDDAPKFAQSCARIFFEMVLDAHQNGLLHVAKTIANGGADITAKCSERINAAITALKECSIVKYDFLKQDRLDGLIASPNGFVVRKFENCFCNYLKKKGAGPVRVSEENESVAPSTAKGKKKRKAPSPVSSDDESEVPYESDASSSEYKAARPTKHTKTGSRRAREDEDA